MQNFTPPSQEQISRFEQIIGYKFNNPRLLFTALSHPSLNNFNPVWENSEKLELLGDAVLSLVITQFLIGRFPEATEGKLAKFRAYLISKEILSRVALEIDLPSVIIMSYGEEKIGGRSNLNNIENAMEALIAAIYLDADLAVARDFIVKLWTRYCTDQLAHESTDYKSALQEWAQKMALPLPVYSIIECVGRDDKPLFKVKVTVQGLAPQYGEGTTRKQAEKIAAQKAYEAIDN